MANSPLGHTVSNISATTTAFVLEGGWYGIEYNATWAGGSVTLQKLSIDGSTWLVALTAFSADGCTNGLLPHGSYRLVVATATGVYVNLSRLPIE